eukprot:TRINITY_DN5142_c0_g1_i1.p1 TRINITY_DN5142_c0_g1~~TRINITY_DN5142_c0_g1_i1.p1  ORF type:complete len:728 (+),score=199.05 TRINITY_DN5142_c0_g1_i1:33-2216(+)
MQEFLDEHVPELGCAEATARDLRATLQALHEREDASTRGIADCAATVERLSAEAGTLGREAGAALGDCSDEECEDALLRELSCRLAAARSLRAYVDGLQCALAASRECAAALERLEIPGDASEVLRLLGRLRGVRAPGRVARVAAQHYRAHAARLRQRAEEAVCAALEKWHYPAGESKLGMRSTTLDKAVSPLFERGFAILVSLHQCETTDSAEENGKGPQAGALEDPRRLPPFALLTNPLLKRFRYHFAGSQSTNKPFKSEWYLTYVCDVLADKMPFFAEVVQPLLGAHYSAVAGLIACLVEEVAARFIKDVFALQDCPWSAQQKGAALLRVVSEALAFDADLARSANRYCGGGDGCATAEGQTLGWFLASNDEVITCWATLEYDACAAQLDTLTKAPDAWDIWPGNVPCGAAEKAALEPLRPVCCTRRTCELLRGVFSRAQRLPLARARALLVTRVHVPLLQLLMHDMALVRAEGPRSGAVLRVLASVGSDLNARWRSQAEEFVLSDLCLHAALANSCAYVLRAMDDWSGQPMFLEIALLDTSTGAMSVFKDVQAQYKRMLKDLVKRVSSNVCQNVAVLSEAYFKQQQWNVVVVPAEAPPAARDMAPAFAELASLLAERVCLASASLAADLYTRVCRKALHHVDSVVFGKLLAHRPRLGATGAAQLCFDVERLLECGFGESQEQAAELAPSLRETCALLRSGGVEGRLPADATEQLRAMLAKPQQ